MKKTLLFNLLLLANYCFAQIPAQSNYWKSLSNGNNVATLLEVPALSYSNILNTYNYTYWDQSFSGVQTASPKKFTNQTSSYGLNIDYTNLNINSLNINTSGNTIPQAYSEANSVTFPAIQSGDIVYSVLQNGALTYTKTSSSSTLNAQLADFGTFCSRRFVEGIQFTNGLTTSKHFTGIDFISWHDRFSITFRLRPTITIVNGQLQLSVTIPSPFNTVLQSGAIKAFISPADNGFVAKGGTTAAITSISGNTITVTSTVFNLTANNDYELSLIFYPVKNNLTTTYSTVPDTESEINVSAVQTIPNSNAVAVTYDEDEGLYFVSIPNRNFGYTNCNNTDRLQKVKLAIENTTTEDRKVRLCFITKPFSNIVGHSSMITNDNGDPSGLPLQVSKNWHGSATTELYGGNWLREYTELIVPALTTTNLNHTRIGAKWGGVYGAFSHQLSLTGYATSSKYSWLEAGLGSFGENVTHSPDYSIGNSNVCDYRPFLVTSQAYGGTSTQCNWTGNVGGMDIGIYFNTSNQKIYQTQNKIRFKRYGPNLSETSYSGYSSDNKLKLDYTFYINRSDDYTRLYYKVKIKALQNTSYNRLEFFQLGGDNYNFYKAQDLVYGDESGMLAQFNPTNSGSNDYTTSAIALTGANPWLWAGDGMYTNTPGGINMDTNNGFIIRSYNATFNGVTNNTPYFRERSSSRGFAASSGHNPTSYSLVPPPTVTSLVAGDEVEMLIETTILPKQIGDYYGVNTNFIDKLTSLGNTYNLLYREALNNKITATSATNTVNTNYPLTVTTIGNTATVTITGGVGYIPVVFSGLTSVTNPKLWKNDGAGWTLVDQSNYGKDFWQSDFNPETGLFDLIFNVNQDIANDATATITYYLGENP